MIEQEHTLPEKTAFPALLIAIFITASFGVIAIGHNLSNKPLVFLDYRDDYGVDYADFFNASQMILRGQNPYDVPNNRYVTTPIPAILNIPFVYLGFDNARVLFYFLITLSLAVGYQLTTSTFKFSGSHRHQVLLAGLVCLLFGYPFYFLLQRENIDGWVFLFLCLGFFGLQKSGKESFSGLFFSLAIVFKVYPLLILIPLLIYKKWRLLFWLGLWLALWGGISLIWFSDFQHALALRSQAIFRFDENGSLVATVGLVSILLQAMGLPISTLTVKFSPIIATLLYAILLTIVIYTDFKLSRIGSHEVLFYTFYLPFMIALPQIVYHYSLIICLILIPVLCRLWETYPARSQKVTIIVITAGLAMTQWQAIAAWSLTDNITANVIPGLGLLIMMAGIAIFKILALPPTARGGSGVLA